MIDKLSIIKQEQKSRNKNKIGLPPNKRYRLTPLARHKSKNTSKYYHLFPFGDKGRLSYPKHLSSYFVKARGH